MKYLSFLFILHLFTPVVMSQDQTILVQCDPETGLCTLPASTFKKEKINWSTDRAIIYIGDPMCSWCWGISPQLNALKRYADAKGLPFNIVMGGLRAGGGEEWNDDFKNFLKHHWREVSNRSGQPFGLDLFELDHFDYDTEPACRAVVAVRDIAPEKILSFYELTQHYFYVRSQDPKEVAFYEPICDKLGIDFNEFSQAFLSEAMKQAVLDDFMKSAQIGVRGFPTVIYRVKDELHLLARGYGEYSEMKKRLEAIEGHSNE